LNTRVFKGLGLGALLLGLLILLLLTLYHLFGSRPTPVPTGKLEEKTKTLPGVSEAPSTPPPLAAPIAPPLAPPKTAISPPTAKENLLAPLEEEKQYGVLVGTYPNFRSAEKMLEKVRKQGEQGFIRRTPGRKKGFQVIAGPFPSRREAEVAANSWKTKQHVSPKLEEITIPVPK